MDWLADNWQWLVLFGFLWKIWTEIVAMRTDARDGLERLRLRLGMVQDQVSTSGKAIESELRFGTIAGALTDPAVQPASEGGPPSEPPAQPDGTSSTRAPTSA